MFWFIKIFFVDPWALFQSMFVSKSGEVLESISIRKATMTFYYVCFIAGIFSDSVVVGIFLSSYTAAKELWEKAYSLFFVLK